MSTHHRKQHFVPKSYLAAWCDPAASREHEPYVWAFPAEGGEAKRKPPFKLFTEYDMYTRPIKLVDGTLGRDLHIEHGLSVLEGQFARTRRDFIYTRKRLPLVPAIKLVLFVVAQHARTPSYREHLRKQWGSTLKIMNELQESLRRMTPEQQVDAARFPIISRDYGAPTLSHEQVRQITKHPLQLTIIPQ